MPSFGKKSLSFFIRNNCPRQFRLSLYTKSDLQTIKASHGATLAAPQVVRAGAGLVAHSGDVWQDKVVKSVREIFGANHVYQNPPKPGTIRPQPLPLETVIGQLQNHQFVVEAEIEAEGLTNLKANFGLVGLQDEFDLPLMLGRCRPDILQVLEPRTCTQEVRPDGTLREVGGDDHRLQLRVIDVKLTSEPGANYFAEVVYYSVVLAAWLQHHGYDSQFCVSADGAVWPGSYEASALSTKAAQRISNPLITVQNLIEAMKEDLELAEYSVYLPRVRRLLSVQLPQLLTEQWDKLSWHPTYRCQSCDFLGYPWNDAKGNPTQTPEHCWQIADATQSVKRVPGLTPNSAQHLIDAMEAAGLLPTIDALATRLPDDPIFDGHPNLRARRAVLPARARALRDAKQGADKGQTTFAIQGSGASAVLPSHSHLDIFISLDYDPSSAITVVMSLRANWKEPVPYGVERKPERRAWGDAARPIAQVVIACDLDTERIEFIAFLKKLRAVFQEVRSGDKARVDANEQAIENAGPDAPSIPKEYLSTYQIYLWDDAQYRHLVRLMTRHLEAIQAEKGLEGISWLFPAETVIAHPDYATRQSPISLVYDAVEHHVAVPVPHHYSLHEVGQLYHPLDPADADNVESPLYFRPTKVRELYREPLTNAIPGERIHEFWSEKIDSEQRFQKLTEIKETSQAKASALSAIVQRLQNDPTVRMLNSSAPKLGPLTKPLDGVTEESRLMHQFTKLNGNLQITEAEIVYALPPAERETRFRAAHLVRRLSDPQELASALNTLNAVCQTTFTPAQCAPGGELWIYAMAPTSRDVKIKAGDFSWALSPRDEPLFLNLMPKSHNRHGTSVLPNIASYAPDYEFKLIGDKRLTEVDIEAIDREHLFIVLRAGESNLIPAMESHGDLDFSQNVMLDKVAKDFLTSKVKLSLEATGKFYPVGKKLRKVAQDFLFEPAQTAQQAVDRPVAELRAQLAAQTPAVTLNESQQAAFDASLSRRLNVIWGPPGTGKSKTLHAIARGAVLHAQNTKMPLRILITANNYGAMDNVLFALEEVLRAQGSPVQMFRVQSLSHPVSAAMSEETHLTNILLEKKNPSPEAQFLRQLLSDIGQGTVNEIVIVGTIHQQIHNLAALDSTNLTPVRPPWFDLVLLDEASQMDSASSSLVFTKIASGGSCVLAGDDLQLPPIHQAKAPETFTDLVGSVYGFMARKHGIAPTPLTVNYRSNAVINDFTRRAGYQELSSYSPDLQLHLTTPLPTVPPAHWPHTVVPFDPAWAELLDPHKPIVCFLYDDTTSGQSNPFEAQGIVALAALLYGNMGRPLNRLDATGQIIVPPLGSYTSTEFWERGVGAVAPHRAQGSLIVDSLGKAFPAATTGSNAKLIREAVDTVERFQGQERDVIFASFGLGDPDIIAGEDEFLYGLNRFNVLVSRACTKLVVFMTRSVLDHLPNDQDVLRSSAHMKNLVSGYCTQQKPLALPYLKDGVVRMVEGEMRWR